MESVKIFKNKNHDFSESKLIFNQDSYIVSVNDNLLGYFKLTEYDSKTVILDYELRFKYQGKGLGNYFYTLIEQYIIDNFDYEKILLMIRYDNIKSTKIAIKQLYSYDNDMIEENEMKNSNIYVKTIKR